MKISHAFLIQNIEINRVKDWEIAITLMPHTNFSSLSLHIWLSVVLYSICIATAISVMIVMNLAESVECEVVIHFKLMNSMITGTNRCFRKSGSNLNPAFTTKMPGIYSSRYGSRTRFVMSAITTPTIAIVISNNAIRFTNSRASVTTSHVSEGYAAVSLCMSLISFISYDLSNSSSSNIESES